MTVCRISLRKLTLVTFAEVAPDRSSGNELGRR